MILANIVPHIAITEDVIIKKPASFKILLLYRYVSFSLMFIIEGNSEMTTMPGMKYHTSANVTAELYNPTAFESK